MINTIAIMVIEITNITEVRNITFFFFRSFLLFLIVWVDCIALYYTIL
jgi:hypothetical protein